MDENDMPDRTKRLLEMNRLSSNLKPPFEGDWKRREDVPGGLNAAGGLADICFFSIDSRKWETGITSERPVQYFVRIHPGPSTPCPVNPSA